MVHRLRERRAGVRQEVPRAQHHRRQRQGRAGPGSVDVFPLEEADTNLGEGDMVAWQAQEQPMRQRPRIHLQGVPGVVQGQRHHNIVHTARQADTERLH